MEFVRKAAIMGLILPKNIFLGFSTKFFSK